MATARNYAGRRDDDAPPGGDPRSRQTKPKKTTVPTFQGTVPGPQTEEGRRQAAALAESTNSEAFRQGPPGTTTTTQGNQTISAIGRQSADAQERIDQGANTAAGRATGAIDRFQNYQGNLPSLTDIAGDVKAFFGGGPPQIDPGVAGAGTPLAQDALGLTQTMIDDILSAPSIAKEVGERALRHQLSIARGVRGGPGAAAAATDQALQAAPAVAADAATAATQEQTQRQQTAAGLAGTFVQGALGFQGQDVDIAQANLDAGTSFNNMLVQASGMQLQADQQQLATMGQFARDFATLEFDWAQLDADTQLRIFDNWVKIYGIDQQTATAIKVAAKNNETGPLDWITGIAGAVGSVAGAVKQTTGG